MRLSLVALLALSLVAVPSRGDTARTAGAPFERRDLRTAHPVVQDAIPVRLDAGGARSLVVVTSPDGATVDVDVYGPDDEGIPTTGPRRIELPSDVVAVDVATIGEGHEALFFLTPAAVLRYDPSTGKAREVRRATSIYRRPIPGRLLEIDFMRNRDDRADPILVLPDFDALDADGTRLPIAPRTFHRDEGPFYRPAAVRLGDMNLDGTDDVFRIDDDTLHVFPGATSGFSPEPLLQPLGLDATMQLEPEDLGDRDQSEVTTRQVIALDDFDGDRIEDILIESTTRSGVLERTTRHELYLGARGPDGVRYPSEPSTSVSGDAPLGGVRTVDIDGDGRLDLTAGSIDVGLGTIISALLTGTVDFDVRFFRLGEDGFPEEPNAVHEARIEFDLSEARASIPVFVLADVNGDGSRDLIVRGDDDEILVYRADGGPELFDDDPAHFSVPLPENGQLVRRTRLDADDTDDLILRHERRAGDAKVRTITLLVARP